MIWAMASTEAWGGPSGNSLPLSQTVSAGATPATLARCANAASVRPAAIIPAKARRENIVCSYRLMFEITKQTLAAQRRGGMGSYRDLFVRISQERRDGSRKFQKCTGKHKSTPDAPPGGLEEGGKGWKERVALIYLHRIS